jgi:hypothetical protein
MLQKGCCVVRIGFKIAIGEVVACPSRSRTFRRMDELIEEGS